MECMQTLPISKVKDKLSEYVDAVSITHEQVTITKNGSPAAVLIGADEWGKPISYGWFGVRYPALVEAPVRIGRVHR